MINISETVSETRRRGRPRVFKAATFNNLRRELRREHPDVSDRTIENRLYQYRAQQLLDQPKHQPWSRWLVDPQAILQGKRGSYRQTILQALGRLEDDADLVAVAEVICERKPTAHEAVRMIRYARRGQKPEGSPDDLADRLIAVLNDYRRHSAGVDHDMLVDALHRAEDAVLALRMKDGKP
jgi:hypothetical protein